MISVNKTWNSARSMMCGNGIMIESSYLRTFGETTSSLAYYMVKDGADDNVINGIG